MLAALLALLASWWLDAAARFIEHDPCPRGCIVGPRVFYQITRDDLVWVSRAANCEIASHLDTDDAPATMWSLAQNFVRRKHVGRRESFGSFVSSYSGCTSARWATGGSRYSPRITPIADVNRKLRWSQIPRPVRDFVLSFFRGEMPNRWPGWCWVWTAGWESHADRRHIGPFYAVPRDTGRSLNAYYLDPATRDWMADTVRIVPPRQ
jgi:hypothetical protein